MFGSTNNNTGGWGQPNSQQNNTGGGLFGGGGGFGQQNTNTGFGSSAFGQPAQQQQPQSTGMFGNTTTTFGGGGGFGQNNAASTQNTGFGARPGFGSTGTSTFGASNTTGGGLFGSNNAATNTFGSTSNNTGGLFGARPATTAGSGFGAGSTSTLFGARPAGSGTALQPDNSRVQPYNGGPNWPPVPSTGTSNPPYQPTWQQDPPSSGTTSSVPPHLFHVVSVMEPYRGASFEELRWMDYQQGRKDAGVAGANATATTSTFGQPASTGFGSTSTGTFGQTNNTFGAPKPAGGLFGSTTAPTAGFGSTSTGFGSTNNTGGGLFGSQNNQQQSSSPFGAQQNNTGGLFGQNNQQQQQQPASGGLFGSSNPFGSTNTTQQPASTGFTFGAPKPATTGFGTGSTGTTGFGSTPAAGSSTFGQANTGSTGFGGFGQTNQQQQQTQQPATGGGLFGGGFGQTNNQPAQNTGGLFGQNNQQQNQGTTGGLFGNTAAKPGGLFGSTPAANPAPTNSFSFGQNNTTQPAAGTSSLFGATNTTTPATGGLFGQTQQQPAQQPAGGLFGGNTGSSLFAPKPAAPAASGSLFNAAPGQPAATGGLFGNTGTSSLFGNTAQNTQNQQKPGGLFGSTNTGGLFGQTAQQPAQQGSGLFSNLGQSTNTGTGLFGSTTQQPAQPTGGLFGGGFGQSTNQQPRGGLTASIDQNPYGNSSLFQYSGSKLDLSGSLIKKPALPPLTSSSFRVTPSKNQVNKLRGFASPLTSSQASRSGSPLNTLSTPNRSGLGSPSGGDRYRGLSDAALSPHAFVPRPSIKKLTVHPRASTGSEDKLESVLGKSALRSSQSSPARAPAVPAPTTSQPAPASPHTLVFNPPRAEAPTPTRRAAPLERSTAVSGESQMKKGDYWCRPRIEKLKQMSQSELRSVDNFVAGRKGYGEVAYLEPVDMTGIDLSQLLGGVIEFGDQNISVYPPGCPVPKAKHGEGCNQPARVQLENCYAVDRATKQPIRDANDPKYQRFLQRIKSVAAQKFISYTADGGVWVFEVEHFSRYGLPPDTDSESEEEYDAEQDDHDESEAASTSDDQVSDEDFEPPTRGLHEGSDSDGDESEEGSGSSSLGQTEVSSNVSEQLEGWATAVPTAPKLNKQGWLKVQEMQSDFFGDVPLPSRGVIDKKQEVEAIQRVKRHLEEKGFEFAEEEEVMLDEQRAVKRTSFGEQVESPKISRMPRKYARVALGESLQSGKEGVRLGAGLALGRSFRCSWGPNGELVHFGKICKPSMSFTPESTASVIIENIDLLAEAKPVESARAKRLIDLHLTRTDVELFDGVPTARLDTSIRFADFARLFENGDRSHEANIWRLGVALFDEVELKLPPGSDDDLIIRIAEIRRKLALSKWLENAVVPLVDHDLVSANGTPEKIFTLLSGNQIDRAVQAAIDGNDMRLSTLVAQVGGSEVFREEVLRQLEDWQKYKVNPLLSSAYRRLYALLAGIMDVLPGDPTRGSDHCADVIISSELDWKRAFGLRLWFGNPFDHTITDVLSTYTTDLKSRHKPATPLPAYAEKPTQLAKQWTMSSQPTDILYGMIKLYSDVTISLDDVLRARDCSPSPLDARLQWHLYMLLAQALHKRDFADRYEGLSSVADGITAAYAAQLEEGGDWTRAAFILAHLETAEGRYNAIKALLLRHPESTASEEAFLLDRVAIPETWLHEARAAAFASRDDAYEQYHSLIRAELFDSAHRVLLDKLAIEPIIRGDWALLRRLCEKLASSEPEGWEYGGKLFLDFLDLTQELPYLLQQTLRDSFTNAADNHRVESLERSLGRVTQLLPALFPNKDEPRQAAALGDMLSTLASLDADINKQAPRGGVVGALVPGDRLQLLQQVAWQRFDKAVDQLAQMA